MKTLHFLAILLVITTFFYLSCDVDSTCNCPSSTGPSGNNPPNPPMDASPENGATGIDTTSVTLSWSCSDPDGDPITYSMRWYPRWNYYYSMVIDSITGLTAANYTLFDLCPGSNYWWRITAIDEHGFATVGQYWIFTTEDLIVNFADPALEVIVREHIEKPTGDLYVSDINWLSSLMARHIGITSLSGMEYMYGLNQFDADDNQISDISPLCSLQYLEYLRLNRNQCSDLSQLSNFSNLETIKFEGNGISDISSLADLPSLQEIYFNDNLITDISPLDDCSYLYWVDLDSNMISDLTPLSNLILLHMVKLSYNQITNIEPLANNLCLGYPDDVYLYDNPLDSMSINVYIPLLEGRGVNVHY